MNNTIIITEGTRTFTIRNNQQLEDNIDGNVRTIRVPAPQDFDVSGAVQSNQNHFVIEFANADIDVNGDADHGNITVTNHPDAYVEVCIK